jgi:acetyl esterase/lipase
MDLPFIQDIIQWLDNITINVNKSELFCIGFSSGGFMTSRIGHYFGDRFRALVIHSGGDANRFIIDGLKHEFDFETRLNISENHPPTLIIHGSKDRLVTKDAAVRYYVDLLDAEIKTHLLLNAYGYHIWQSIFNEEIFKWFSFGYEAPSQPKQPDSGPGGKNYSHSKVIENIYGAGVNQYWIFEPADPTPESAPLIIFNHGWGAMYPRIYGAWIEHIVKRGNIVVYPRYQRNLLIGFKTFSENAINAVKNAIYELENGEHVTPELERFAITGHSLGGGITANMAARAEEENLPIPKAIMPVQPAIAIDTKANFNKISNQTIMLIIVGQDDTIVGDYSGKSIFYNSSNIPYSQKDFIIQVTDNYGYPIISSDHGAPTCEKNNSILTVDAMDYYSTWKLFDALTDYAFYGENSQYCLGNTTEQRYMGKWSDQTFVKELIVTDNP